MKRSPLHDLWLPIILAVAVLLTDLVLDRLTNSQLASLLAHLVLAALVAAAVVFLLRRATSSERAVQATLRQARDELEARVAERTSELADVNAALKAEIAKCEKLEEGARQARRQAETEQRHLTAILQALPVGVVVTDAQGGVLLTNGMDAQIWGPRPSTHDVGDYVQYKAWWADSGRPVEAHEWASAQAVERGESVLGQVLEIERFDGGRRFVVNSAVPIRDAEGHILGSATALQDITELRRAEQALRESEERLRTVVENSRDGINMLDLKTGRYIFMSPAQVALTGFRAEELQDLPVEEAFERVHPDDREISISQQQEIAAGRDPASIVEYRWKVKSGEYRWFSDSRKAVRDSEGRAIALVGISRDITEQKQAEAALRESEEKYRLLFQNMAEGFALYELIDDERGNPVDWRVLEVNDAYVRHTGLIREQIAGRRISELFPGSVAEYLPLFAQVVATQAPASFESYSKAVGRYHHVTTFPAGGRRFASIIEDVSVRKRAEIELRRQATILSQLNEAVIVLDNDQRITYWNEGAERLYGYSAAEVVGRAVDLFPEPAFTGSTHSELMDLLCRDGQVSAESTRLTKDGRQVWIESRAVLIPGGVDEPGTTIWVDRDITARVKAEEALRRAEAELVLSAQERAALEERQRLARELHDSVSQALYGISLGVHTALNSLDRDASKTREALEFTLSQAATGLREMRGLIFELWPEPLADEGLVAALSRQAEQLRVRRGVHIELDLCHEPQLTLPAKEAIYRIGKEAMLNAIKHAHSDRVLVRLECQPDGYVLDVSDNGTGFDPGKAFPGHLGLRSMRERALLVGGRLDISSSPDRGTHIRAFVPSDTGV